MATGSVSFQYKSTKTGSSENNTRAFFTSIAIPTRPALKAAICRRAPLSSVAGLDSSPMDRFSRQTGLPIGAETQLGLWAYFASTGQRPIEDAFRRLIALSPAEHRET